MDARDRGGGTDRSKCKPGACRIVRFRLSHLTKAVSRISATIGQVKTSSKLLHHLDGSAKAEVAPGIGQPDKWIALL